MKQIALASAVEALGTIFNDPEVDTLTPQDIFQRVGRDRGNADQNKKWLRNRLTPLKYYGLVETVYKLPGKTVDKIRLTPEGKKVLEEHATTNQPSAREVQLESIVQDIKEFERQNPSLKIQFTVTRRDEDRLL
jgi:hypothetical protein